MCGQPLIRYISYRCLRIENVILCLQTLQDGSMDFGKV